MDLMSELRPRLHIDAGTSAASREVVGAASSLTVLSPTERTVRCPAGNPSLVRVEFQPMMEVLSPSLSWHIHAVKPISTLTSGSCGNSCSRRHRTDQDLVSGSDRSCMVVKRYCDRYWGMGSGRGPGWIGH